MNLIFWVNHVAIRHNFLLRHTQCKTNWNGLDVSFSFEILSLPLQLLFRLTFSCIKIHTEKRTGLFDINNGKFAEFKKNSEAKQASFLSPFFLLRRRMCEVNKWTCKTNKFIELLKVRSNSIRKLFPWNVMFNKIKWVTERMERWKIDRNAFDAWQFTYNLHRAHNLKSVWGDERSIR